ncbi:hypothetical protein SDC9_61178 [bioreactor metagenome]|uniref:Uncharacterized protein n=1 Tax=bioreactor metagenome TaxID=1076179 RepID=A0A644XL50_9ZZZZ
MWFRRYAQMPLRQSSFYIAQYGDDTRAAADAARALRPQSVEMRLKFPQNDELIGVDHNWLRSAPAVNGEVVVLL